MDRLQTGSCVLAVVASKTREAVNEQGIRNKRTEADQLVRWDVKVRDGGSQVQHDTVTQSVQHVACQLLKQAQVLGQGCERDLEQVLVVRLSLRKDACQ